jgi:hypothetical protein
MDDFTNGPPLGGIRIWIKEIAEDAIKNVSGYYLFLDIDARLPSRSTVSATSYENYYQDQTLIVTKSELHRDKAITLRLIPSTTYPFSADETLLRGLVTEEVSAGVGQTIRRPIEGAKVQIVQNNVSYTTGSNGQYIIYLRNLSSENLDTQKRFIKIGSDTNFELVISHSGFPEYRQANLTLEVSKTTVINANLGRRL